MIHQVDARSETLENQTGGAPAGRASCPSDELPPSLKGGGLVADRALAAAAVRPGRVVWRGVLGPPVDGVLAVAGGRRDVLAARHVGVARCARRGGHGAAPRL